MCCVAGFVCALMSIHGEIPTYSSPMFPMIQFVHCYFVEKKCEKQLLAAVLPQMQLMLFCLCVGSTSVFNYKS